MLNSLANGREFQYKDENFFIMAVRMEDLLDSAESLFCAGMAFGGKKVAVFSFHRYHSKLRTSLLEWWNYGYSSR